MAQNKEIKFQFVVDERSAQQTKRVLTELIGLGQKLAQTLNGVNLGGAMGGGGLIGGGVGGPQTAQQMITGASAPKTANTQQNRGLAQIFLDSSKSIKGLADVSKDSMRVMSDAIKRAVSDQKRSISDLDDQLARLAKRYDDLKVREKAAISGGHMSAAQARAHYDSKRADILSEYADTDIKRSKARKDLGTLHDRERQMAIARDPYSQLGGPDVDEEGRPGFGARARAFGGHVRSFMPAAARIGGMAAAGAIVINDEIKQERFDYIRNKARQQQAFGSIGVGMLQGGDMSYLAALRMVNKDHNMKGEFHGIGSETESTLNKVATFLSGTAGGVLQGSVTNGVRKLMDLDSATKERLRGYLDQTIASDPRYFTNLNRFQGEAGSRVGVMRQLGVGSAGLSSMVQGYGEDSGLIAGAFGAMRSGGRTWGRHHLGLALNAHRAGMDMGVMGALMGATAAGSSGRPQDIYDTITGTGTDVVASENLARGIGGMIDASGWGPTSGIGLAGRSMYNMSNLSAVDQVYQARQRAMAMPALAGFLGGQGDGLATGINVLSANKFAGGDIYKANALAQLGSSPAAMFDAMKGKIPAGLAAMGVTKDDAKGMFQDTITRNVRARLIRQDGQNLSPAMKAMQSLVDNYGGDFSAMLSHTEGKDRDKLLTELGAGLSAVDPGRIKSADQGKAIVAMLSGSEFSGGLRGDAAGGSAERKYERKRLQTAEKEYADFVRDEKKNIETFTNSLEAAGKLFLRMGDMDVNADKAAKSLTALSEAADNLTAKLGGKPPTEQQITKERQAVEAKREKAKAQAPYQAKAAAAHAKMGDWGNH